jgi:uncharacterized phage protein (TIGR02218 family)
MAYDDYESSIESGRPIHLYRFTMGGTIWRYTSADEDLTIDGYVWKAAPIKDDGVRESGDAVGDMTQIEAPSSIGPAQVYMSSPPNFPIMVHRLAIHEGVTVPVVSYTGEIMQVDFPQPGLARISCQKLSATMRRNGLRIGYQRTCPYALYDPVTCKVDKSAWGVTAVVSAVDGFMVSADALASYSYGYFAGGFVEWDHPIRGRQYLAVDQHIGTSIEMFGETNDMYVGLVITAYPGCSRTLTGCNGFNNVPNYGGFPGMPGRSPYDGNPVF